MCALIVVTALRNPVEGAVSKYTATFSDVSGLFVGDDVRISGVQVGKVDTIRLNGRNADVDFTVVKNQPVYSETVAAVRYQNLVGQRYLELAQPEKPGTLLPAGSTIPIGSTIPSFDVAKLFNGFRPIFRTLDPAQFNQLGENLLRLIQGDESGVGPVLRDLDEVSAFATDRQAVFITLIRNLSAISVDLGGKSKQVFDLITTLNGVLIRLTAKAEQISTSHRRSGTDTAQPGPHPAVHRADIRRLHRPVLRPDQSDVPPDADHHRGPVPGAVADPGAARPTHRRQARSTTLHVFQRRGDPARHRHRLLRRTEPGGVPMKFFAPSASVPPASTNALPPPAAGGSVSSAASSS